MANWNKRTKEEVSLILSNIYTINELVKKTGRDPDTLRKWAKEFNVKNKRVPPWRKYSINENFFDFWNENMAYVLGFIAADGYVCLDGGAGTISIGLAKKDFKQLENINFLMESNYPIKYKEGNNSFRLDISSGHMAEKLYSYGIFRKKSLILKYPSVPSQFASHFVRGYFDGDGCVMDKKQTCSRRNGLRCSILGTNDVLINIKKVFNIQTSSTWGVIENVTNQYRLAFNGTSSSIAFCEWIYKGSTEKTRLERKHFIYEKYLQNYNPNYYGSDNWKFNISISHLKLSKKNIGDILEKYEETGDYRDIAKEYGKSNRCIKKIIKRWKDIDISSF